MVRAHLGLFTLLSQCKMHPPHHVYFPTTKDRYARHYEPAIAIDKLYSLRFGLLYVPDNHQAMTLFSQYSSKVETTCRFLLKSCLHALFSMKEPGEITRILFDGNEHHDDGIDTARLTKDFDSQLRDYVQLHPELELDDRGRHDRDEESGLAIDFADNIIGGWRAIISKCPHTQQITSPLSEIYDRARNRKLHVNHNSRWFKRLSFSEFSIQNGTAHFPDLFRPGPAQESFF